MENWDNIRFFLAVARSGTVSAAAIQLQVTHTTVLRRISQFEQQLDTKLFKRLQSGYQLSEAGQAMLEQASLIEVQTQALTQEFKSRNDALAGTLRISQPESHVIDLYPLYKKFIATYPQICLRILASSKIVNLNQRKFDVAIRMVKNPPELLIGRQVGKIHFGSYCHRDYLASMPEPPNWEQCDWIVWHGDQHLEPEGRQLQWLKQFINNPKVILETSNVADIINAVRAGIGIGLISHDIARKYSDLIQIPSPVISKPRRLWVLAHQDARNIPRVSCFMRFMSNILLNDTQDS